MCAGGEELEEGVYILRHPLVFEIHVSELPYQEPTLQRENSPTSGLSIA